MVTARRASAGAANQALRTGYTPHPCCWGKVRRQVGLGLSEEEVVGAHGAGSGEGLGADVFPGAEIPP